MNVIFFVHGRAQRDQHSELVVYFSTLIGTFSFTIGKVDTSYLLANDGIGDENKS